MHGKGQTLPYLACLIAATLWGLLWFPLRVLESQGLPGIWASLLIYISALLPVLPYWYRHRTDFQQPVLMIALALAAGWTNLAFILALLEGTVARVLLLFYLSPIWAILLARLFLHEIITRRSFINLILAACGAAIMLWDDEMTGASISHADLLAITSGMAFAVTNLLVRKSGDIPIVSKMVPAWIGVILLGLLALLTIDIATPVWSLPAIMLGIGVGLLGMTIMTFTAQYAATHLPLQKSAVIFMFEVPIGAISAAILSAEVISTSEYIGGALVMYAAWSSTRRQ